MIFFFTLQLTVSNLPNYLRNGLRNGLRYGLHNGLRSYLQSGFNLSSTLLSSKMSSIILSSTLSKRTWCSYSIRSVVFIFQAVSKAVFKSVFEILCLQSRPQSCRQIYFAKLPLPPLARYVPPSIPATSFTDEIRCPCSRA